MLLRSKEEKATVMVTGERNAPDVEEEGGRRSLVVSVGSLGHLSLIEIDHVADLCPTPVYDPIVPVEGQLVPGVMGS